MHSRLSYVGQTASQEKALGSELAHGPSTSFVKGWNISCTSKTRSGSVWLHRDDAQERNTTGKSSHTHTHNTLSCSSMKASTVGCNWRWLCVWVCDGRFPGNLYYWNELWYLYFDKWKNNFTFWEIHFLFRHFPQFSPLYPPFSAYEQIQRQQKIFNCVLYCVFLLVFFYFTFFSCLCVFIELLLCFFCPICLLLYCMFLFSPPFFFFSFVCQSTL